MPWAPALWWPAPPVMPSSPQEDDASPVNVSLSESAEQKQETDDGSGGNGLPSWAVPAIVASVATCFGSALALLWCDRRRRQNKAETAGAAQQAFFTNVAAETHSTPPPALQPASRPSAKRSSARGAKMYVVAPPVGSESPQKAAPSTSTPTGDTGDDTGAGLSEELAAVPAFVDIDPVAHGADSPEQPVYTSFYDEAPALESPVESEPAMALPSQPSSSEQVGKDGAVVSDAEVEPTTKAEKANAAATPKDAASTSTAAIAERKDDAASPATPSEPTGEASASKAPIAQSAIELTIEPSMTEAEEPIGADHLSLEIGEDTTTARAAAEAAVDEQPQGVFV